MSKGIQKKEVTRMGKNFTKDLAIKTALGFVIGFGVRQAYDSFNKNHLIKKFREDGEIPKKKSEILAIILTVLFGSLGLVYVSPRVAVPLSFIEYPFAISFIPLFIIVRPITILLSLAAAISRNKMIDNLFGYELAQRRGNW